MVYYTTNPVQYVTYTCSSWVAEQWYIGYTSFDSVLTSDLKSNSAWG